MHLHRRFSDADVVRNLFVEAPGGGPDHDLALPWAERVEAFPECSQGLVPLPSGTIAREPGHDRIEEILIAERFCQELDGASLHRPHSHRNVAVRSDEDHWKVSVRRGKLTLEIEATSPWHSHVHHQAGWTVRSRIGAQIFGDTRKLPTFQSNCSQQPPHRVAKVGVVIDDQDTGVRVHSAPRVKGQRLWPSRILLTICGQEQPLLGEQLGHKPWLRSGGIALSRLRVETASCMRTPSVPRANCLEAAMPKRKNKLVAIVEDNQPFRESMQKLITLLGYPVEAFPSAASFLASPFVVEVACLVADVHMPGMTGPELHRHLKNAGHKIPTILVTAYPDEIVRERALKDGVFCYLCKPVDDDHLERCLGSAVRSSAPPEQNS